MEAVSVTPSGAAPSTGALSAPVPAGAAGAGAAGPTAAPPALVRRVEVVGSSLPAAVLERLRARFTGRPLDAATGARAAAALQAAYARADVALAQVGGPALGGDGVLTVAVLEGRLEGVDVTGGTARERRAAHHFARRLLRESPLTRASYERATALIALMPGVRAGFAFDVTPRPGVLRLRVELHAAAARFDLRASNRGAVTFGAWQGRADARGFSVLRGGDQALLTLGASPDARRLRLVAGAYATPLGSDGLTLAVAAAHVESDPARSGLSSRGTSVRAALAWPLLLRWDRQLTAAVLADGQDGQNVSGAVTTDDERTRNLRLALTGTRLWGERTAVGGVLLTGGVPVAGARAAHPGYAPTGYAKVSAYGGLATPYGPWTVRLHAAGQAAGSRLPSAEQFTLGGDQYGRGFQAVSLQGDDGIAASAELALRLRRGVPALFTGSEAFAYLDGGALRVRDRPGVRGGEGDLASAGVGLRLGVGPAAGLELSADRAFAYRNPFGGPDRSGWRLGVRLHLAWAPGADAVVRASDVAAAAPFNPLAP